jgi:hypothetical protein
MQRRDGLDAISHLTDILFEDLDGPTPSFPATRGPAPAAREESPSLDIVDGSSSWQPAP